MAGALQFDLVSPERKLASLAATEVQIPGADGDLTAMAGHAPTITTLRPGILKALGADGAKSYVVTGGFADITATGVSVLAERAIPVAEATAARAARAGFLTKIMAKRRSIERPRCRGWCPTAGRG